MSTSLPPSFYQRDGDRFLSTPLTRGPWSNDHQHGGLETEEQAFDDRELAEQHVDPRQRHDGEQAGQHEQRAGEQPALGAMHQPADIGRELLRLGAGQQRAIIERLQEAVLADPLLLLDDDAMHHRDLSRRAAEAEDGHAQPDDQRFVERNAVAIGHGVLFRGCGKLRHAFTLLVGQLWVSPDASRHQR